MLHGRREVARARRTRPRARRGSTTTTTAAFRRRSRPRSGPPPPRRSRRGRRTSAEPGARPAGADAQRRHGRGGPVRVRADDRRTSSGWASRRARPRRCRRASGRSSIGAGVSGLATSIGLAEAGIPHVVLERNATVGGTWLENHYPGAGVDTPSALYSFSFAPARLDACTSRCATSCTQYLERPGRRLRRARADPVRHRGRSALRYDEDAQEWVGQHAAARRCAPTWSSPRSAGSTSRSGRRLDGSTRSPGRWCTPRAGRATCRWPASGWA